MSFYYKLSLIGFLALAGLIFSSVVEAYSCYRHIYNDSKSSWDFQATKARFGNIYFLANGCPENGPCVIHPEQNIEIQYTANGISGSAGTITITDDKNVAHSYDYSSGYLQCPIVNHQGDTGAVALNNPANGDYTIVASSWG